MRESNSSVSHIFLLERFDLSAERKRVEQSRNPSVLMEALSTCIFSLYRLNPPRDGNYPALGFPL